MKNIILENKGFIRSIVHKITGQYDEDIEQEIYIKAWINLPKYTEEGKFRAWIGALSANVCRDWFRSRQHTQRYMEVLDENILNSFEAQVLPQEEVLDSKSRQKIILKAVDELPSKMRQAIILLEFEGFSIEQISRKTGVPEGTIKSRLFNAKKILNEKLKFLKGE